ncbi:MAG: N-acetylneuraminate synthase family protein [Bacteroidota bacterium]|nr:N-acetylneuraminate synthase family protein [Bacteroidota bacterium]
MKIIAESAFNHNGNADYLLQLADAAKLSDADYFTAQVMDAQEFSVKDYSKYQVYIENEISVEQWKKVFDHCKKINMEVIPCVLDENSFELCYSYGFRLIKIHATDIVNEPFLKILTSRKDCRYILETQVATNFDIRFAIAHIGDQIECLINGYSNYPTEIEDLNINIIDTFKNEYNYKTGFADHSTDITEIPLMLLAKGCDYLEKHITLTRNNRNFDWQVSLYPNEFKAMVAKIRHYELALGNGVKHPVRNELPFRSIIYKKVVGESVLRRADTGLDFVSHQFNSFKSDQVVIALIARLKSQRLPLKVLKPFLNDILIADLYTKLTTSKYAQSVYLATSNLPEDAQLVTEAENRGMNIFKGHPISVIDRMLSLAWQEKAGAIFRVTGDNPFTDVNLIDEMIRLYQQNDLDYVRVNNVPFGVSAELFSVKYLWNLYLNMDNPMNSEYLSWFIMNDKDLKMGCIDVESSVAKLDTINFSVDYPEDLENCYLMLKKINKKQNSEISLADIIKNSDYFPRIDPSKEIKLPEGEKINLREYLDLFKNANYFIRKTIVIK